MTKNFIILIIGFMLCNCSTREGEQKTGILSYLVNITDNEDAGIKDVLGFYGGYCEYSIGKSVSTEEKNKKFFEIKLSKSEGLDQFIDNPKLPASNIAYRFYRNLNKEERNNYTYIKPVLAFSNGKEIEFEFSTWELEILDTKMNLLDKVVTLIAQKQFNELAPILIDTTEFIQYDKYELINNLKKYDSQFGNVTEEGFRMFGYSINALDKKGNDVLNIYGAIIRDVQANEFTISMDPYSDDDKVYLLQYKI